MASDRDVACETHLAAYAVAITDFSAACHSGLRCEYIVATDLNIVGNHYKIVEFRTTTYPGASKSSTVYCGIGSDLNIILYHHDTCLWKFLIFSGRIRGKSETIATNHHTTVKDAAIAYVATGIYLHACIKDTLLTYRDTISYICLGINLRTFANDRILTDI